MLEVIFSNAVGTLDSETCDTPEQARDVVLRMLRETPMLLPGDRITVREIEGELS